MASLLLKQNLVVDAWSRFVGELAKRYFGAVFAAFLITASLFLLMQYLISGSEDVFIAEPSGAVLTFSPEIEDEAPKPKKIKPEPPPPVELEPEVHFEPPQAEGVFGEELGVKFDPPTADHKTTIGAADGGILPIVTVAPSYPRRMASQGIEGWVLLEFSVDPLGRVQNAQVIEAQPSSGFNQSAMSAIVRYKYKPQVVDGKASWVHGVQSRIVFKLEGT